MTGQKLNPALRRKARRLAMQALYQWHVADQSVTQIEAEFLTDNDVSKFDKDYFSEVLRGVAASKSELDSHVDKHIDRALKDLTPVELAILRMGAYEFLHRIDVPYKVIINEGVELSKTFGANEAHRFVNGVLDKLAQDLRSPEVQAGKATD
ncbi:transcription antitermination factor NusB [Reinekea blandensis]|uniref:Transcription antitermination protein NusB n=1 Tax=Reinekea blandensis MED297 TaxID=314283 RepID=A4BKT9_9GAMM|nr:transcription antitermination factor NusB [Reinekea blandensis]EAR07259.1 transcription antitermination protein NusB [Reinekea sp. MED297] [Reinekea blandensis MED297]